MISDNNPDINVDELMAKIHEQVSGTRASALIWSGGAQRLSSDAVTSVASIEELLDTAESASQVRTALGTRMKRLPFFSSPGIQSLILKALAFLFRDQRHVNAALVDALRQSLSLNVRLCEEIDRLKARVAAVEGTLPDRRDPELRV